MKCNLCPRNCGIDRSEKRGACGVGEELTVARAALHFYEEPCVSGTNGSGTVFFSGCTLRCVFCQNYEISQGGHGREITPSRLAEIFEELRAEGAHNINLVTPTHFTPQIIKALRVFGGKLPVIWNSSGYESVETLRMLDGLVDVYMPDFKYGDDAAAARYSAAPDYFRVARAAIDEMFRQTGKYVVDQNGLMKRGVLIRHLVLPENFENSRNVMDYVSGRFSEGDVLFSLMGQYVPMGNAAGYPEIDRPLTAAEYDWAVGYMRSCGITDGFVQELSSADSSFTPAFDFTGV